jgi:hypothetical protein
VSRLRGDRAGGSWRPAWAYGVLAVAVVAGAGWLLWDGSPDPGLEAVAPAPAPNRPAAASAPLVAMPTAGASAVPAPSAGPAPVAAASASHPAAPGASDDLAAHVPPGQVPTMTEVIDRLHQAGVRTGLGAFNPPGTRPPLIGLAVPEDFALPPGYLRHHQATDDGQRIEAILMFDPDHPPPLAAGRPLATPADRVVPAELAPPGLPIRLISLPPPAEPGSPRR